MKKRTNKQNRALHLFFTHLADELNNTGLEMQTFLASKPVDIPWNSTTVKELIYRPIMKAQLGKRSTTELTTKDIDAVFDTLNRHLSETCGLTVEFPSIETIINKQRLKEYDKQ